MGKPSEWLQRQRLVRAALTIEVVSVVWTVMEALFSGIAAVSSGSLAMSAFSVDSAVELISGIVVLSRFMREAQVGEGVETARLERFSSGIVALCLFSLSAYIAIRAGQATALRQPPAVTELGLVVAVVSSVLTPWLAVQKRKLGQALHSHALMGDAACSLTCAFMAWTLLGGLVVSRWVGWWWVDAAAAIGILYFILQEAFESAESARTGEVHHHH